VLSRFSTTGQQKRTLAGMADGSVDIVIGTHRLAQADVKFDNLLVRDLPGSGHAIKVIDFDNCFPVNHPGPADQLVGDRDPTRCSSVRPPRHALSLQLKALDAERIAARGAHLIVQRLHGDPAGMAAIGMLSGFCGTLMTPMAANFNVVPASLLELPDRDAPFNGVIRAQVPTALLLLVANTLFMYFLALPAR